MEFKSVSAKLSMEEVTLFKVFCKKKGVTPAALIKELILRELKVPIPHNVAGKNTIRYEKEKDKFIWSIELDNGKKIDVMKDISPEFLEDLQKIISDEIDNRSAFIGKREKDSVSIPSTILRGDK